MMLYITRREVFFHALLVLLVGLCAHPADAADASAPPLAIKGTQFVEKLATRELLTQLRQGGFALYLRHATTDNSKADRLPSVDLNDCSTQRQLTEQGRVQAARVGQAIRAAHIPIQNIHISPMCRVKDTAAAAFPGRQVQLDLQLMYTGNLTDAQKAPIVANTRRLLAVPVAAGSNRLVIAHGPNLMDLMGYFPKEATLVVFRPKGDAGFDYVASIPPDLWTALLPTGGLK
jgi:phosphohistidine phosphatase SixA